MILLKCDTECIDRVIERRYLVLQIVLPSSAIDFSLFKLF
jgi:hypothetical protein